ncbi:MAG: IPTL-CTERM sorting domain-containing protein, partial [Betaproteobacteria bacterium]
GAPARASFPVGVFSFTASGAGCTNATLSVLVDYPAGSLRGLQPYKYGPATGGAAATWFPHGTITGDTVTYSVADNGVGDNNPTLGAIADPFAPVLLAPGPGGATAIPTLGEWGLIVLSLLAAAVGAAGVGGMRRQAVG